MDIFNLFGSVSLDTSGFITNVNNAYNNMNNLYILVQQFNTEFGITNTNTTNTINSTTNTVNNLGNSVDGTTKKLNTGWTTTKQILSNLATQGINWTINFSKSFLQTGYEFNMNMEKWRNQIQAMLNLDTAGAEDFLNKLRNFAIETPYSMSEVMTNAVKLLGTESVRGVDIIELMTIIGNLSNGDTANFGRIAKAYTQVATKGKLRAEEANQQFAEAGIDAWAIVADYFSAIDRDGKDEWDAGDVSDLSAIPASMVTFEEFHAAMKRAAFDQDGEYADRMWALMDTAYGRSQKMQDNYEQTAGAFAKSIFEVFNEETITALNDLLSNFFEWASAPENQEALRSLASGFSDLAVNGINVLIGALQMLVEFYAKHRPMFDAMLMMIGGLLMSNGQPGTGAALMAVGAMDMYSLVEEEMSKGNENLVGQVAQIFREHGGEYGIGKSLTDDGEIYKNPDELFTEKDFKKYSALRKYFEAEWDANRTYDPDDPDGFDKWNNVYTGLIDKVASFVADNPSLGHSTMDIIDYYSKLTRSLDTTLENLPDEWFTTPYNGAEANIGDTANVGITGFIASLLALPEEIRTAAQEGITEGMSGITITGTVTTGNMMLDTGVLAGTLAPRINLILGRTMGHDNG